MTANLFAAPKTKKEVYIPMDYSTCGYHASEKAIPDVHVNIYVAPQQGDCSNIIQQAIDYISQHKADKNGHRGCVLLGEGTFNISKSIHITSSGVVLRGVDKQKTIIKKTGYNRGAAIYLEGQANNIQGDTITITDEKVIAGSTQLTLASTMGLHTGSRITIVRPCTTEWIQ